MGRVGTPLATEVDFGVTVAACGAGHLVGLGGGLVRGRCGRHAGIWRIARIVVPARRRRFPRLEALHRGPGLHQGAIDREVVVRQQRCHRAMRQDGGMTLRDMSVVSSRSRFFVNTVGTQTASSMPRPTNHRKSRL